MPNRGEVTEMDWLALWGWVMLVLAGFCALVGIGVYWFLNRYRKKSGREFASLGAYLRTAPTTDREKRNAVDLAFTGGAICLVGILFPPLLLVGLFPLFFGARKVAYGALGLGLVGDADRFDG